MPLTHPEYYEEMGIKPPKGVILYGSPGTGKRFYRHPGVAQMYILTVYFQIQVKLCLPRQWQTRRPLHF